MVDKHDVRRLALALNGVIENGEDSFNFQRDGRGLAWPYPERVHPKKARVPRYDQFVLRVADADDKEAHLLGEPEVFFTTDHYVGFGSVIVRLDAIDEARLRELVREAWEASPLSSRLIRTSGEHCEFPSRTSFRACREISAPLDTPLRPVHRRQVSPGSPTDYPKFV